MKFEYELSKKNYEKLVNNTNSKIIVYDMIIASIIYLFIVRDLILDNLVVIFITYLILMLFLYLIIKILTKCINKMIVKSNEKNLGVKYGTYNCTLDKKGLVQTLDDYKVEVLFSEIEKTKIQGNDYYIYTKKLIIAFNKGLFKEQSDYEKVIDYVEKNKEIKKVYNKKEK